MLYNKSDSEKVSINGVLINKGDTIKMQQRILLKEIDNINKEELNDRKMVDEIMHIIEEEIKCY